MNIHKVWAVYFSPVGNTERVAVLLAEAAAQTLNVPVERLDYTLPAARHEAHSFCETDLVIWATPVYAGRMPNKLLPYVKENFGGGGALAVPVAVFGNRSMDDALVELRNILETNGFHTVAAAAVAAQHAFSDVLATGRPDRLDCEKLAAFASRVAEQAAALQGYAAPVAVPGSNPPQAYYTPRGLDGNPAVFLKAKPKTDGERCNRCGECVRRCPMGSINPQDPADVTGVCIKCHACVKRCARHAKYFDDEAFLSHKAMLERDFAHRAESVFLLG